MEFMSVRWTSNSGGCYFLVTNLESKEDVSYHEPCHLQFVRSLGSYGPSVEPDLPSVEHHTQSVGFDVTSVGFDVSSVENDLSSVEPDVPSIELDVASVVIDSSSVENDILFVEKDVPSIGFDVPSVGPICNIYFDIRIASVVHHHEIA
ncbi:uncharacterized protein FA14DRAFT_158247 [Meira miltonrushii]|uniref:Uncharacterized protein n=1 Tax=Meira miltonrushii TaxID=1280837 RepID=A0A316V4C9_9BASI|nr:uncharacterized protein FA14DRAFT_158247 [Meira miltonrushii]PWN32312.1 hypothetical protein FA14DRAFT_158247 [Meira miltonrushii]